MLVLFIKYIQFYKPNSQKLDVSLDYQQLFMNYNILSKKEGLPEYLLYEEGDIVLAKCVGNFPEPGTIVAFRGYDIDEQEVFKVKFPQGSWANLPIYFIEHLTYSRIRELTEKMKNHHTFIKNLGKAEKMITELGEGLGGLLKERFDRIYLSEEPFNMDFFGDNELLRKKRIESSMSLLRDQLNFQEEETTKSSDKLTKKRKKFNRCKLVSPYQIAISIIQIDQILQIWTNINNIINQYEQEVEEDVSIEQTIKSQVEIYEKTPLNAQSSQKTRDEDNSTSIEEEGDSEKFMDNEMFKSIQKQITENFERLQKFIGALKQKNSYGIDERYMNIDGMSLLKIQGKIKQIFQIMKGYSLTVNQIKLLYANLNRFLYIFVEYHSAGFLLQNIIRIKELIAHSKNKEKSLEKVPVLNVYEWTNQIFGRWQQLIEKELKLKKSQEKTSKPYVNEINTIDRLRKDIFEHRQKYKASLSQIRKFFQM